MRFLVLGATGATGATGTLFMERPDAGGHEVVAFVRDASGIAPADRGRGERP